MEQNAFQTPAPELTAQVNCASPKLAASNADAWLAQHFQKQNARNLTKVRNTVAQGTADD
jgi:hypothetical protein